MGARPLIASLSLVLCGAIVVSVTPVDPVSIYQRPLQYVDRRLDNPSEYSIGETATARANSPDAPQTLSSASLDASSAPAEFAANRPESSESSQGEYLGGSGVPWDPHFCAGGLFGEMERI